MMHMKRILLFFSALVVATATGQTDNELHAIFIKKEPLTAAIGNVAEVVAEYPNVNISSHPAPQNEPSVCISRTDPEIIVAAWRDFRLGYLEPDVVRRIGYSFSTDGGQTWSPSQLLPDPNPDHISQSDPVVICDMDGDFYISSTSRQPVSSYNREMLLYKSTDNGQTFFLHDIAVPGSGWQGEDKEWIYVDPFPDNPTYNHLMIAWRSFGPSYGIKFRKSEPGGSNWSSTVNVGDTEFGQGANLTTTEDGKVIVVWSQNGIQYDISYDGGEHFGTDRALSSYSFNFNSSFPFIATDHSGTVTHGNVYVIWADARLGSDDIYFQRSADGGETWLSQPVLVNDVIQNNQYWPSISVGSDGKIYVIYYDERQSAGTMNAYLAWSDDAGDTWTNSLLSEMSFPGNQPNSNVRYGDYIHIDACQGKAIPVWTDDRTGDYDQEIYAAVVDLSVDIAENENSQGHIYAAQNIPNPFSRQTAINIRLERSAAVSVEILTIEGKLTDQVYEGMLPAGQSVFYRGEDFEAGIYICVIRSEGYEKQIKMIKTR